MSLVDPLEGTPQLPADVLQTMLEHIPSISEDARRILGPMQRQADALRALLLERDWIEPIDASLAGEATVAAVDGAQVQQPLYAGDLVVAVAVAAEGLKPAGRLGESPVHKVWATFLNHDSDNDRLGKAAMVAEELALLRHLPHDMCILDGSHQTPVIVINSALSSQSRQVRQKAVEVLIDNETAASLADICDPEAGGKIVASPKSDSSKDLGSLLRQRLSGVREFDLPATDKVLASLVLEPGEMFKAFPVPDPWSHLHIEARSGIDEKEEPHIKRLARDLNEAIRPLREKRVRITYAKPADCSTAVKIEFKERKGADWRRQVGAVVSVETPSPHLQEPFAQHLADQWAKSIGTGVQAQLQGVRLDLAESGDAKFLEYMLRSYRTFGG
ncbi:hypothetical protein ABZ307_30350 [Streptomyces griseorubiginosus]|uniref:hypothetical protein n=1 Tax=Streptomyces griseorubiginosus TaxID=67304 RepID=UPI0033ABA1FB